MRNLVLVSLLVAFLSQIPAVAEDPCTEDMDVSECQTALVAAFASDRAMKEKLEAEKATAALEVAKETLDTAPAKDAATGADPFASNLAGTLTNYLDFLEGAFEIESVAEDGTSLTLNWVPGVTKSRPLKFQSVIRKPELLAAVEEALPEDGRADAVEELEGELRDFDDVEIVASYRLNSKDTRLARDYPEVFAAVIHAAGDTKLAPAFELQDAVERVIQGLAIEGADDLTIGQIRTALDSQENYSAFLDDLRKASLGFDAWFAELEKAKATYLDPFAKAINNKTQWIASASYRLRNEDGGVGPDQWKLNARYEHGFLSNPEKLAEILQGCARGSDACLDDLAGWTKHAGKHRLVASLDYEEVRPYRGTFAGTALDLDSSHCLVFKLAYGLYLDPATTRRLALDVSYEDVSSDPTRQDRWMGSLVVSQQLASGMEVTLGAVYANHAKFLGEVDEPLSAHFGLNYSFNGGN